MKTSLKISLGGAIAAVSLVLMLLTMVIPFGTFAFPAFAGMLLTVIVIEVGYIEVGYGFAVSVFAATALLSFLIVSDKEAALMYTAFFGFYPILKSLIERIPNKVVQYIVKLAVFNACMIAAFFIGVNLLSIPAESYNLFGLQLPVIFLLFGNVFFVLYDYCITKLVTIYLLKWRQKLNKNTKL